MWKIAVGFVLFAGLGMFILIKSGADIEMGGETHGSEITHTEKPKAAASAVAPAPAPVTTPSMPAVAASAASQ